MTRPTRESSPWLTALSLLALILGGPCACVMLANALSGDSPLILMTAFCIPALGLGLGMLVWQGVGALRAVFGFVRVLFSRRKRSLDDEFSAQSVPPGAINLLIFPTTLGILGGVVIGLLSDSPLLGAVGVYGGLSLVYGAAAYGLARAGVIFDADWWISPE